LVDLDELEILALKYIVNFALSSVT